MDATSECMGAIIHPHRIIQNRNLSDKFVWWRDQIGFSVIPAHAILLKGRLGSSILHAIEARTFRLIWSSSIHSNIQTFGWRFILNRL